MTIPAAHTIKPTELSFQEFRSAVWSKRGEIDLIQPTEKELQAMELFVSGSYTKAWSQQKLLDEGITGAYHGVWTAPRLFGIA